MNSSNAESLGKLHIVGTPIGNIADLSVRARDVLAQVDLIAAEDTRRTRGLLSRIGVKTRLIAYHEHNEETQSSVLIAELERGRNVALVSDAGTPLISDPGWRLVAAAAARGAEVSAVPGPSALVAALSIAGLPTDRFVFEGFLPRRKGQRRSRLEQLACEERTLVFFESVHRLEAALNDIGEAFGFDRPAAVARELTKLHEQVARGTLAEIRDSLGSKIPLLGEFVLIVGGAEQHRSLDEQEVLRVYQLLLQELPPEKAVNLCAAVTGESRNTVYSIARA